MRRCTSIWTALGVAALMLVHLFLAVDASRNSTLTLDEVGHLPAGMSYLQTGSFRMYHHNPPLARLLTGLAGETGDPTVPYDGTWQRHRPPSPWLFGLEFLAANEPETISTSFGRGRMVTALWSMLTIPILFAWGTWWFSCATGWTAAFLWTFSPNVLAHAGLITTDIPAANLGVLTSFLFARWLSQPGWGRALLVGAAFGLAQLTKFSALGLAIILPVWGLASWWAESQVSRGVRKPAGSVIAQIALMLVVSLSVINAGYLGEGSGTRLDRFELYSDLLTRPRTLSDGPPLQTSSALLNERSGERVNRFRGSWLGWIPVPLPFHYVAGFDEQKFESEGRYQMYLAGELRTGAESERRRGWWHYYLYALAVKLPLSTWLLLGMALVGGVKLESQRRRRLYPWLLLTLAPIVAMSFLTDINLGLRYILPAFPTLLLLAATAAQPARPFWWSGLVVTALLGNVIGVARIHPHEISYFNELIGGPSRGRLHLIDSNLDWGQDLGRLGVWLMKNPQWGREVRLAYMGSVPPELEGISNYRIAPRDLRFVPEAQYLPWEDPADPTTYGPQPGKFAVSVNLERGMQNYIPCPLDQVPALRHSRSAALVPGTSMLLSPRGCYSYFQELTPRVVPEIGYSILLYDVSRSEADRARKVLGLPPLPPEEAH